MPRESTGEVRVGSAGAYVARIRVGEKRETFELPTCRTEEEARKRSAVMGKLAKPLSSAFHINEKDALEALRMIGDASAKSLPAAVKVAEELLYGELVPVAHNGGRPRTGTVVKTKSGLWQALITLDDGTRKRMPPFPPGTTREAAKERARATAVKATKTKRTGRPRKGSLEFRGKTWHARLTFTEDSKSARKWVDLKTQDRDEAERLLREVVVGQKCPPTDDEVTEMVNKLAPAFTDHGFCVAGQLADAVVDAFHGRLHRRWALTAIVEFACLNAEEMYFTSKLTAPTQEPSPEQAQ